jgi:hypothetical protein
MNIVMASGAGASGVGASLSRLGQAVMDAWADPQQQWVVLAAGAVGLVVGVLLIPAIRRIVLALKPRGAVREQSTK